MANDQDQNVRVVGIGASAGAMEPLKEFFHAMAADSGLAFVVIQHLDPSRASLMSGLLARQTTMTVVEAEDGAVIEPNCVYTIPSNKYIFINKGVLRLTEPVRRDGLKLPIDYFFRSLAQDQAADAIAVLFSGGGSDGTLGIREVHGAGGLVIVQNPESAQFDSMVESAIATGLVDYVLPVQEMPAKLLQYARQVNDNDRAALQTVKESIDSILELLLSQAKSDFRFYKKNTVRRRIERRMGINHLYDMSEYCQFLRQNPEELEKLAKDMLIGVTSFFRDPDAFKELREKIVTPMVRDHDSGSPLRVWISGCATGEEAYSIVILLLEEMAQAKKNMPLQVFASDIDRDALRRAREGRYPESISVDVSEERLARFFIREQGAYQMEKGVRDCVTFAEHNLLVDPPFMRMDLISCRNLLIYIEPGMQERILNLFAFALRPGRYLFLGKSDTTVERSDFFQTLSRNWRMFQRVDSLAVPAPKFQAGVGHRQARFEESQPRRLSDINQQVLLEHFDAAMVIVSEHGEILHFHGPTEKYLKHPVGDASLGLYDMIDQKHALVVRLSVERAARENRRIKLQLRAFNPQGEEEHFDATISPAVEPRSGKRLLGVIFQPTAPPAMEPAPVAPVDPQDNDVVRQLQSENERLKHDLQSAIESFQVTHEEFTSANEEVLSINEELQSANEELETSKEELQSVNEELITVNSQLSDKVEELTNANNDLSNFLNTSEVGTLFLDRGCCIRRFTPSMSRILNVLDMDVGRPVNHIASRMSNVDLVAIATGVLRNLSPYEQEVMSTDGRWYMLYCVPYRTSDNVIDGVVFAFTDVTRLKESEQAMRQARNFAENIVQTVSEALLVLDPELKIVLANRAFYEIFQVASGEVEGRLVYDLGNRQWHIPRLQELLEEVSKRDDVFENFEVEHDFPHIGHKIMSLKARKFSGDGNDQERLILLAIEDITEHRQAEAERSWLEGELRQAQKMESLGTLAAGIAHDINNDLNIIQSYALLLKDLGADNELIAESVSAILECTRRGAAIVQQLLTLARKTEPRFETLEIESVIEELAQLVRQTFPKTIEVELELKAALPAIEADRNQLLQTLLNLCVNARDAMPEGGKLTLTTDQVSREALPNDPELSAQQFIMIEVRDTGFGMSEEVSARIFEPFFTTKETGHGTGLGLSVVYGIVRHHKGYIQVNSKPKGGTSFKVYLPGLPSAA